MNQCRTIKLTLLASITAVSLAGCGKSPKEQARERAACAQDRNSEDCTGGGRSHSGIGYFFYGRQSYGQPSYYGTPAYSALHGSPSFTTGARSSVSTAAPGGRSGSAAAGEGGFSAGSVSTGGFGASAAGHAGGGGGGE